MIEEIARLVLKAKREGPLRVGIDGIDAAGKTYLANALAAELGKQGATAVLRASIDGFHNPKEFRYQRGPLSPEGYYSDSFNYELLKEFLLTPLEPGGNRRCRLRAFDFRTDQAIQGEELLATEESILVFDGVFLFRPEIEHHWDFKIFVEIDFETSLRRALERDLYLFGEQGEIIKRYRERYLPGQKLYLDGAHPGALADIVIDNDDFTRPRMRPGTVAKPLEGKMQERKYEVDIDLANQTKAEMASSLESSDPRVMNKIGAFASLFDLHVPEIEHPVLVMKTEEPGSKQLLAFQSGRVESLCRDMINHLINDCIVMGATPLVVQDAVICGKIDRVVVKRIVAAVSAACREQGCTLTGGETSEQPGVLAAGSYVLTSSIVGVVDRDAIIDGSRISPGDVAIGLESSGPHTNGYTLIRRLLADTPTLARADLGGVSFFDRVMESHRCYYQGLKDLFPTGMLRGLAHITGGGIKENLNRILPPGADAIIDLGSYRVSELFRRIRDEGHVSDAEMLRTFNMGVGLVAVARPGDVDTVIRHLSDRGFPSYIIGEIARGDRRVETKGTFSW